MSTFTDDAEHPESPDLETQLGQVIDSMAMLRRAAEAGHRAAQTLRDLPDEIHVTIDDEGLDSHIEVVLREADPRIVAHGEVAGCGDCLISVRYVATAADGTEIVRYASFDDPDFTPMYAWWAEARTRLEEERDDQQDKRRGRRRSRDAAVERAEDRRRAQKWARQLLNEIPQVDKENTPAAIAELAAWWMRYTEPAEGENTTRGEDFADNVLDNIIDLDDDLAAEAKPLIADWFDKYSK